tara:strand:+ start:225 stop:503 length:279 start_codon:yes stop_codon:yes gene_type:complete
VDAVLVAERHRDISSTISSPTVGEAHSNNKHRCTRIEAHTEALTEEQPEEVAVVKTVVEAIHQDSAQRMGNRAILVELRGISQPSVEKVLMQ